MTPSTNTPTPVVKIGITGGIRSGKDTVADIIEDLINTLYTNDTKMVMGFADGIRDLMEIFLPELLEGGKPRKAYQGIGQELRQHDPDVWVKYALKTMELNDAVFPETHYIVKDVRQPNEAKALQERGFTIIKVVSDRQTRIDRAKAEGDVFNEDDLNHETEKAIDLITPDTIIYNNGTLDDLYEAIEDFLLEYQDGFYHEGE